MLATDNVERRGTSNMWTPCLVWFGFIFIKQKYLDSLSVSSLKEREKWREYWIYKIPWFFMTYFFNFFVYL